jgi:hypothetical protein
MTTWTPSRLLAAVLGIGSVAVLVTLAGIDPAGPTWALLWVSYAVMSTWVIWRQPSNRIGWLLMAVAAIFTSVTAINWFVASGWGSGPVGLERLANVLGSLGWLTFLLMVLWGAAVTVATVAAGSSASRLVGPSALGYALWIIGGAARPASIAVAVTRYRRYDIDRVISRTAAYALVTVSLVAIFAALVATSSSLLGPDNLLGVTVATLVAAAIAGPVYRKVQLVVDRRNDRARFDGRVTVEDFGQGLSQEVDTLTVADDLERTTQGTLAPTTVGPWLRGNS